MIRRKLCIEDPYGIHMTVAEKIAASAGKAKSKVTLSGKGKTIDASNFLSVLSLSSAAGDEILLAAEGPDEENAADEIEKILKKEWHARELEL